jgi:hypothetical protein
MSDLQQRLIEVVRYNSDPGKMFSTLVSESGIKRSSWSNALTRLQRPTAEMIEFVCTKWPGMAFYIATGSLPSATHVHTKPFDQSTKLYKISDLIKAEPKNWDGSQAAWVALQGFDSMLKDNKKRISRKASEVLLYCRESGMLLSDYSKDAIERLTAAANNTSALQKYAETSFIKFEEAQSKAILELNETLAAIKEMEQIVDNKD